MKEVKIEVREREESWQLCKEAALFTQNLKPKTPTPTTEWKHRMIKAEHSPLYLVEYVIKIYNIPYCIAMHFKTHSVGVVQFAVSQRPDRNEAVKSRHDVPQDAPVNLMMVANGEAIINISRKRLCKKADPTTSSIWTSVVSKIMEIEPAFRGLLVSNCLYRGGCPEMQPCYDYEQLKNK